MTMDHDPQTSAGYWRAKAKAAEAKLAAVRKLAVLGSDSPNKAIAELCQEFVRLVDAKDPTNE